MPVKPLTLEKRLNQMAQKSSANYLYRIYECVKDAMSKLLPSISEKFPHYSRHDISHAENILGSIEKILGNKRIAEQMSIGDIWLTLITAYLHDIGMLISSEEEQAAWKSEAFTAFLSTCEQGDDKDLRKAAAAAQRKESKNDPLLMKKYVEVLTSEFFRPKHAERSKEIITGHSPISKFLSYRIPEELQNVWERAGNIVALHGRNFSNILDEEKFLNFPIPHCGDYHPRFVAVLLRLGDLCDVKRGRFNNMSLEQFGLLSDISAQHFYKHKTMNDPNISEKSITITAEIKFDDIKAELPNEMYPSETEREDFCQKVVYQHVNWFHMLDSELANFTRYRDDIFPDDMNKDIPKFDPRICVNREKVILSLEDLRFNFSREKAFELIEGYSLYDEPLTFVRELIQNSLDALKQQMWFDLTTENSWFEELIPQEKRTNKVTLDPFDFTDGRDAQASLQKLYGRYRIDISVEYDPEKRTAKLTFEDNGIGITREDIKNKILQTGASWQSLTYQEQLAAMPPWLRPTGSFGIGLHSVFAVTDHFRIETKSVKEPKGNIIVLHSGKGNGFVFSRPDETIKKNGTRVILEAAVDKIPDVNTDKSTDTSPYEKLMDNPVLEALRKYIKSNVIRPLFDVYFHDAGLPYEERVKQPPLVKKLCDNIAIGKIFDPAIRNRLSNGTPLFPPDVMKRYDIAIPNNRPLRFIIWDKKEQALYDIEPISNIDHRFNEEGSFTNITYMGIGLREQRLDILNVVDYLDICCVDFLAGNGKADITANRNKLKWEKEACVSKQLNEAVKAVVRFGQELFSKIIQADITQRFLTQAEKDAACIQQYDSGPWHFIGLKDVFQGKNPSFVDQVLYTVFVFRFFVKKNLDTFRRPLESFSFPPDDSAIEDFCRQFARTWCNDQFLKHFIRRLLMMCRELAYTFGHTGENYIIYIFGKQFATSFGYDLAIGFCNDLSDGHRHEMGSALSKEFATAFGSEFGNEFCDQFGYCFADGLLTSTYELGCAFGVYGYPHGETDNRDTSLCGGFSEMAIGDITENSFHDKLADRSSDIHIDLLANDNWAWILWLSDYNDPLTRTFLEKTGNYFIQLAGFNSGYGFDRCNDVIDICLADRLTGLVSAISDAHSRIPFLRHMSLTQVQRREEEFLVTLERDDSHNRLFVSADNDIIFEWLKEKRWIDTWGGYNLFPCFTPYVNLGIYLNTYYTLNLSGNRVAIPSGTPALIFPREIDGTRLTEFLHAADNAEAAVAGIMACEQVTNIVDYIWRCRLREGNTCSREKIRSDYERLMRDFVNACWE